MSKIVHLEITSWVGQSIGAQHFYGKLVSEHYEKEVELKNKLTRQQAARANKIRRSLGIRGDYKSGQIIEGFETKQEIIVLALACYKEHFPDCVVFLLGRVELAEPKQVLAGPELFMKRGNELYERNRRCHSGGGWDRHRKQMTKDCYEFDTLLMELVK